MIQIIASILNILNPKEKKRFIWSTLSSILINLFDVAFIAALVFFAGSLYNQKSIAAYFHVNQSIFFLLFAAIVVLKMILGSLILKNQFRLCYKIASRISEDQLSEYYKSDFATNVTTDSSYFIRAISVQPGQFAQYLLLGVQELMMQLILVTIIVLSILVLQPHVFILLIGLLGLPIIITFWWSKKKSKTLRISIVDHYQKSLQALHEALKSYVDANIYSRKNFFIPRFASEQQKLNDANALFGTLQAAPPRYIETFTIVGFLIILLIIQYLEIPNTDIAFTIGTFIAAAYKLIPGTSKIINLISQIRSFYSALAFFKSAPPTITADINATNLSKIEIRDISFGFSDKKILQHFNAVFQKGDFKVIKASSGKGKTTLINLLLGFVQEKGGEIYYNEELVDANARKEFWPYIAYVKQDNFLIYDTIEKNITLDNQTDIERLLFAIKTAGLAPLIDTLPGGTQHIITENGKNISGGQKQRIALARALYKDADVYILDEPFSELDHDSEEKLLQFFKKLSGEGKIVILVTHSKSILDSGVDILEL